MAFTDLFGGKFKSQYNLDSQYALLTGITKDATGAALAACVVRCFRTTPAVFVSQTVSDGSGNYRASSLGGVACFCVAYKAGSPDVAGTTVNTLIGTGGY